MKYFKPLLFASAISFAAIGGAYALPLSGAPQTSESAQNARIVCDQFNRCYNTRRHRGTRYQGYGYQNHGYDNGYYHSNRYGFGPFGIF